MTISAIARGLKNMAKYITIGVIAGLVYHIVHGLMTLSGGGHGEEGGKGHGEAAEGAAEGAADAVKGGATNVASKINLAKESFSINESGDALAVDMSKNSSHTSGIFDTVKKLALPAVGGLLMAALSHFFPIVHTILEAILVSIGIFELIGAVCQIDSIKSKNLKVCTLQHKAHHFIEGSVGGGH
jgi:hypothetical protein